MEGKHLRIKELYKDIKTIDNLSFYVQSDEAILALDKLRWLIVSTIQELQEKELK